MVYVSLDSIGLTGAELQIKLFLDMHVIGFVPNDHREAVGFLTKVFKKLSFDYTRIPYGKLSDLGYLLDELSRDKIYLTTISEDTYHYEYCAELGFKGGLSCAPVYLYVDRGSPFRHFIYVRHGSLSNPESDSGYTIVGIRYDGTEYFEITVGFYSTLPYCTAWFCTEEFEELLEKLASDPEIYVGYYPGASPETIGLARAVLKAANAASPLVELVEKMRKR